MGKFVQPQEIEALEAVVTIHEAARMWGLDQSTIRYAIIARHLPLQARQSSRVWLITLASLERRYGKPKFPISP